MYITILQCIYSISERTSDLSTKKPAFPVGQPGHRISMVYARSNRFRAISFAATLVVYPVKTHSMNQSVHPLLDNIYLLEVLSNVLYITLSMIMMMIMIIIIKLLLPFVREIHTSLLEA